jgi:hypothetical protein
MFVENRELKVRARREEQGASIRSCSLRSTAYRLRPGLSLTEVLISMGILTLGLLGVASVFPVGSLYMQKADVSDRGSAIAQSVFSDLMARGMLNPRSWYVMTPNPLVNPTGNWDTRFSSDGIYSSLGTAKAGTFTRPFALALGEALNQPTTPADPMNRLVLAKQFGSAFVIDPLGVSVFGFRNIGTQPTSQPSVFGPGAVFPAGGYQEFFRYTPYPTPGTSAWFPWSGGGTNGFLWPIRRVTFRQSSSGVQWDPTTADHYFRGNDDLTVDFPARDDRPGIQNWDMSSSGTPLARKWTGDYSWLVTVVPPSNAARDAMATNPEGFAYEVSVVVFYKRVLPDSADNAYPNLTTAPGNNNVYDSVMGMGERAVGAKVTTTGPNGGELLLSDWSDAKDMSGKVISPFDQLKSGEWIMLCGPHPNSSTSEPRLVLNWYQVISIDKEGSGISGFNPDTQRVVAVRGAEWPWQPNTTVGNGLCVAICKGAVAVHTKSIRLESGSGNASGSNVSFSSSGTLTTTPPPYTAY